MNTYSTCSPPLSKLVDDLSMPLTGFFSDAILTTTRRFPESAQIWTINFAGTQPPKLNLLGKLQCLPVISSMHFTFPKAFQKTVCDWSIKFRTFSRRMTSFLCRYR